MSDVKFLPDIENSKSVGLMVALAWGSRKIEPDVALNFSLLDYPASMTRFYYADCVGGISESRNRMVEMAIKEGSKWLFMHDDDVSLPRNTLTQMHYVLTNNPGVAAVTGIICQKDDIASPMVWKDYGCGPSWDWKVGDIFEIKEGLKEGDLVLIDPRSAISRLALALKTARK